VRDYTHRFEAGGNRKTFLYKSKKKDAWIDSED
jgi:hypothetical protein